MSLWAPAWRTCMETVIVSHGIPPKGLFHSHCRERHHLILHAVRRTYAVFPAASSEPTTHPSARLIKRFPYPAFASEWVTWMIVVPSSLSFLKSSMISLPWLECRLPVGSSARISLGFAITARATATNCCCPPESWLG